MKILAVGGGSGGHVTPVVAVLKQIRHDYPDADIRFWCDRPFRAQATSLVHHFDESIKISTIIAGKLRRYHHLSLIRQLLWPRLVLLNLRDSFFVGIGLLQSIIKLMIWRPDVVFTKGGYVCLPVGLATRFLRIPLVIHDSDAHPGLTNRILARFATSIATGAPLEYYSYPKAISKYIGIPIAESFIQHTKSEQKEAKQEWGIPYNQPLIVITGGGLGAQRINETVAKTLYELRKLGSVILICGAGQYDELRAFMPQNDDTFQLHAFITDMPVLLAAADVVVTRAGMTTILELAALAKPTILIPNAKLTGGHQVKNAAVYKAKNAVVIVNEEDMMMRPELLVEAVHSVLVDTVASHAMAQRFAGFAKPHASKDMARMIIAAATSK
jgi:UDP-N-acetylglucosamine--N-acetylmuramyl-(pentapeptide) pyrophosphoryl-undecaprenol N-acetylglucosamine transferase